MLSCYALGRIFFAMPLAGLQVSRACLVCVLRASLCVQSVACLPPPSPSCVLLLCSLACLCSAQDVRARVLCALSGMCLGCACSLCTSAANHAQNNADFQESFLEGQQAFWSGEAQPAKTLPEDYGTPAAAFASGYGCAKGAATAGAHPFARFPLFYARACV